MSERLGVQGQETEAAAVSMEEASEVMRCVQALADGLPADAFAVLGPHTQADGRRLVRVLAPGAEAMGLIDPRGKLLARMQPDAIEGVFEGVLAVEGPYRLRIVWPDVVQEIEDPYAFAATLDESVLLQIAAGDGQALR
ncbi:GlgB N-terminal domain-containing protein, partial [Xanthomonas hortorum]|nr:1,4-alpha-glucan branching enzyme [Xanthomonas hortorum pv. vitians]